MTAPTSFSQSNITVSSQHVYDALLDLFNLNCADGQKNFAQSHLGKRDRHDSFAAETRRVQHQLGWTISIFAVCALMIAVAAVLTSVEFSAIAWIIFGVLLVAAFMCLMVWKSNRSKRLRYFAAVDWEIVKTIMSVKSSFNGIFLTQWDNISHVRTAEEMAAYIEADIRQTMQVCIRCVGGSGEKEVAHDISDPTLMTKLLIQLAAQLNLFDLAKNADVYYGPGSKDLDIVEKSDLIRHRIERELHQQAA